jgi:hypothetical protein
MTDEDGRRNRLGAGSYSLEMRVEGAPINCYLNHHPETGRVEVIKQMPRGVPDKLLKDFDDEHAAWTWVGNEYRHRRLP